MGEKLTLKYVPDGKMNAAFYADTRFVAGIQGPVGSGKTTAALMKQLVLAQLQPRSKIDGIRRYRCVVVRDTYRDLWRTTIKSWWKRVPQSIGEWVGGKDQPATHTIRWRLADGSVVEFIIDFVAIGDQSAEDALRGYEMTRVYLNEADLLADDVFDYAKGRVGRYPDEEHNFPIHAGIDIDCNAPSLLSWLYKTLIQNRPAEWSYYVQPPAVLKRNGQWVVNPDAENLRFLPPSYYEEQLRGAKEWYILRMLANRPSVPRHGRPVYEDEWSREMHVAAQELLPEPGLPLLFGFDAGGSPAGIVGQRRPSGQWRILDEIIEGTDGFCGPDRFSKAVNRLLATPKYAGFSRPDDYHGIDDLAPHGWGDPSAMYGFDEEAGEQAWLQIVAAKTKISIMPAPSNALPARLDAVKTPLGQMIGPGTPAVLISPACIVLTTGFDGLYAYAKITQPGGASKIVETPAKNGFSHPHDALQYLMLGGGEYETVMGRQAGATSAVLRQAVAMNEDNPRGIYRQGVDVTRQKIAYD